MRFLLLAAALLAAGSALAAQGVVSHAIAMHGKPKYGPDFRHFDYVNPRAPKGGELRLAAEGTFDSFHPFIPRGTAAAGAADVYETLLVGSADEPFTEYGLLAESIQMPDDRSWVAFTLRPEYMQDVEPAEDEVNFADRGIPVHVIGVGTTAGGVIPEPQRASADRPVVSRLDRESLATIATAGGGRTSPKLAACPRRWTRPRCARRCARWKTPRRG